MKLIVVDVEKEMAIKEKNSWMFNVLCYAGFTAILIFLIFLFLNFSNK